MHKLVSPFYTIFLTGFRFLTIQNYFRWIIVYVSLRYIFSQDNSEIVRHYRLRKNKLHPNYCMHTYPFYSQTKPNSQNEFEKTSPLVGCCSRLTATHTHTWHLTSSWFILVVRWWSLSLLSSSSSSDALQLSLSLADVNQKAIINWYVSRFILLHFAAPHAE